jgi:hypothetical protein
MPKNSNKTQWQDWFVHVLWASYCYRLVNKVESFYSNSTVKNECEDGDDDDTNTTTAATAQFGRIPTISEWPQFKALVQQTQQQRRQQPQSPTFFTGAHQTCSFDHYIEWMDLVSDNPQRLTEVAASEERTNNPSNATSLESYFRAILLQLPGCGAFLSWQILCDLIESNAVRSSSRTTMTELNEFCVLGKGAKGKLAVVVVGANDPLTHRRMHACIPYIYTN